MGMKQLIFNKHNNMLLIQKTATYLLMLVFAAFIAAVYGILHDQMSYTFSNEYFTKFKFEQFGILWAHESPRLGAAYVGALATWWMGVLIFIFLGLFGFTFKTPKLMAASLVKSFVVVIVVASATGLLGLLYGYSQINGETIAPYMQWVPPNVLDPIQFVRVGYMHNASYLGGLIGLVAGILYLRIKKLRYNKQNAEKQNLNV